MQTNYIPHRQVGTRAFPAGGFGILFGWLLALWLPLALAGLPDTPAIPLAELGQRADKQQAPPKPVLEQGQATLNAPLQALRGKIGPHGLTVESTSASRAAAGSASSRPGWMRAG